MVNEQTQAEHTAQQPTTRASQQTQQMASQATATQQEYARYEAERVTVTSSFKQDVEEFKEADGKDDIFSMRVSLQKAEGRFEQIKTVTQRMIRVASQETVTQITKDRESAFDELIRMKIRMEVLREEKPSPRGINTPQRENVSVANALPEIKLSKFNGDPHRWGDWKPLFDSMVHDNDAISTERKFFLLRMYTKDAAHEAIAHLPKEESYYETARTILKQKFDRPQLLKKERLLAMRDLPLVTKVDDYNGLKRLHQKAISLVYGLTKPNTTSPFNEMLAIQILEKLPLELQAKWQRKQRKDASLNLTDLFEFIDELAEDYEMAHAFSRKAKMDAKTNVSTSGEPSSGKKTDGEWRTPQLPPVGS